MEEHHNEQHGAPQYFIPTILHAVGRGVDYIVQFAGVVSSFIPVALIGFLEGAVRPNISGINAAGESVKELVNDPDIRRGAGLIAITYATVIEPHLHLIPRVAAAWNAAMTALAAPK